MKSMTLYFNDLAVGGKSDKVYSAQIVKVNGGFVVDFQFGRRGGTMQTGSKTPDPVPLEEAESIFASLEREKRGKGYTDPKAQTAPSQAPSAVPADAGRTKYPAELLEEVPTDAALRYIADGTYWMQIKYDGHRRQIEKRADGTLVGYNKLGNPASIPFEVAEELKQVPGPFFMDGELVGDSFVAFDIFAASRNYFTHYTYRERFDKLVSLLNHRDRNRNFVTVAETWRFTGEKRRGYDACIVQHCEGVVFKNTEAVYRGGESRQHFKAKFTKTASCKVIAVGVNSKANAAVALLDGSKWVEVAHVSTIGKGKVAVGDVVEVEFLFATEAQRLREPRIKEVRNDEVGASECTIDQLKNAFKGDVAA